MLKDSQSFLNCNNTKIVQLLNFWKSAFLQSQCGNSWGSFLIYQSKFYDLAANTSPRWARGSLGNLLACPDSIWLRFRLPRCDLCWSFFLILFLQSTLMLAIAWCLVFCALLQNVSKENHLINVFPYLVYLRWCSSYRVTVWISLRHSVSTRGCWEDFHAMWVSPKKWCVFPPT